MKKAIVSVIGKDKKGIIAGVTDILFKMDINVADITQTVMQDYFTMIMLVELDDGVDFSKVKESLAKSKSMCIPENTIFIIVPFLS